jgi:thioredoxin-related protein
MKAGQKTEKIEGNDFPAFPDPDSLDPQDIPVFKWRDEQENIRTTAEFEGYRIMVILFSIKCTHCRKMFDSLDKGLGCIPDDLSILCIGRYFNTEELKPYFRGYQLTYKHVIEDPDARIYSLFAKKGVPRIFLYDKNGRLVFRMRGYHEMDIRKIIGIILQSG